MTHGRVLLIDDEIDLAMCYHSELVAAGIEADVATHPLKAIEMLAKTAYEVIVTDLRMPMMSGFQVAGHVRASELNRTAKIILVSGALDEDALAKAGRMGVVECLPKPLEMPDLVAKIRQSIDPEPAKSFTYAPRLIDTFRDATGEILRFYLGNALATGTPCAKASPFDTGYAAATIPLFGGRVFGSMGLVFDRAFLDAMVKALFQEAKVESDAFVEILGESCTQIADAVRSRFDAQGLLVHVGLPQLVQGPAAKSLTHLVAGQTLCLPFRLPTGAACHLEICLGNSNRCSLLKENEDFQIFLAG